jgi:hypothetical protein
MTDVVQQRGRDQGLRGLVLLRQRGRLEHVRGLADRLAYIGRGALAREQSGDRRHGVRRGHRLDFWLRRSSASVDATPSRSA